MKYRIRVKLIPLPMTSPEAAREYEMELAGFDELGAINFVLRHSKSSLTYPQIVGIKEAEENAI